MEVELVSATLSINLPRCEKDAEILLRSLPKVEFSFNLSIIKDRFPVN
jgi:hypothetical protein